MDTKRTEDDPQPPTPSQAVTRSGKRGSDDTDDKPAAKKIRRGGRRLKNEDGPEEESQEHIDLEVPEPTPGLETEILFEDLAASMRSLLITKRP